MGCFVRGGKNGMGCFVRGDKNYMGWQIDVGCFVRGGKKWHGMFCPGMFCPTFDSLQHYSLYIWIIKSIRSRHLR